MDLRRRLMAQPCSGSRARIFRSSRSRVPWTRSAGLLISVSEGSLPRTPLGKQGGPVSPPRMRALAPDAAQDDPFAGGLASALEAKDQRDVVRVAESDFQAGDVGCVGRLQIGRVNVGEVDHSA